jgi:peptidyl-prolyl cis-trans isomerase C
MRSTNHRARRGANPQRGIDVMAYSLKRAGLLTAAGALMLSTLLAVPAMAADKVLAKVNGKDVTEADLRLASAEIGPNLGNMPPEQRTRVLVEYITENRLMAEAADKAGFGNDASMADRLAYYKGRALRDVFFAKSIEAAVPEADAKALYEKKVAEQKPVEEIRASHILVEKEDEAKDIVAKLKAGGDFAALAKEKSKDTGSGAQGGDLGYFAKGQMVKPFEEAAWALKNGEISVPVQSQFGWHVIKLVDKRNRPAPTFDSVRDRIMNGLVQQKYEEIVGGLRKAAKIEIVDEDLKKQMSEPQQ